MTRASNRIKAVALLMGACICASDDMNVSPQNKASLKSKLFNSKKESPPRPVTQANIPLKYPIAKMANTNEKNANTGRLLANKKCHEMAKRIAEVVIIPALAIDLSNILASNSI